VIAKLAGEAQSVLYDKVMGALKLPGATEGNFGEMVQHGAEPEPTIVCNQSFFIPTMVETVARG
jgi:hypothetical protein